MIQQMQFPTKVVTHPKDFRLCKNFGGPVGFVYTMSLLEILGEHYGNMWICSLIKFKED